MPEPISKIFDRVNEKSPYLPLLVAVGVLLAGYYFLVLQFQVRAWQNIQANIRTAAQGLEAAKNNIQRLPQYEAELKQLQEKSAMLERQVRKREELPAFLENISRIANKSNVKIEQMIPQTTVEELVGENKEARYLAIPIGIDAASGYHDFGRFLNRLEDEGLFAGISSLVMAARGNDPRNNSIKIILKVLIVEPPPTK